MTNPMTLKPKLSTTTVDLSEAPQAPNLRTYVLRETATALVINSALSLAFAALVAHGRGVVPLWGPGGMAIDFGPQLFMMTFATTLAVTLITRQRLRTGKMTALSGGARVPLPVPKVALIRAIAFAVLVAIVFWPPSLLAMSAAHVESMASPAFLVFKVIYGAVVSLIIAPPITLAALRQ